MKIYLKKYEDDETRTYQLLCVPPTVPGDQGLVVGLQRLSAGGQAGLLPQQGVHIAAGHHHRHPWIQYSTVQYSAVQYSTVKYRSGQLLDPATVTTRLDHVIF